MQNGIYALPVAKQKKQIKHLQNKVAGFQAPEPTIIGLLE